MNVMHAKVSPVLKWAGGKSRLYKHIQSKLPKELIQGKIKNYYEPFFGGGAVFFNLIQSFEFKQCILSDINEELMLFYQVIQKDVNKLISFTEKYLQQYSLLSQSDKEKFYYDLRETYNIERFNIDYNNYSGTHIPRASQMLFLNKTCYNGLYRQSTIGKFNTPFGKVYVPSILKKDNLKCVSNIFKQVEIKCADFQDICDNISGVESFVYLDPPYKDNFSNYYKANFSNEDQIRLANVFKELDDRKVLLMMNNSSLKEKQGIEPVEEYYKEFKIGYLNSNSTISSDVSKRKKINEIVITNY